MPAPDLSVIIVNYNGKRDLPRCLASLAAARAESPCEVLVVDNGSTDGSPEDVAAAFPWVRLIRSGENLGFGRACNVGLAEARGRHFMLLNPDTEVQPGALPALVAALDAHGEWGIVGPQMLDGQGRLYPAARRFPTPFSLFCETTRLAFLFPHSKLLAGYFYGEQDPATLDRVDQVEGSALVISGAARARVGDLDPRFFLFFEEVDWCRRVWNAGYEIHIVPAARVVHHLSTTMSRFYLKAREANATSALQFFAKHEGAEGVARLRRWMRAGLLIREVAMRLAALLGAGEKAKLRAEGARLERAIYRRGLAL